MDNYQRPKVAVIVALSTMVAFGPMAMDLYLPAFPTMARQLGVEIHVIELTLSAFVIGFALGPLLYGPLSDRFGRLRVLTAGVGLFIVTSVLCAISADTSSLIGYRFMQGLGGAAAPVLARTAVRDLFEGNRAASVLSMVQGVMLVAPLIAPLLGGYLLLWFGWRSMFWLISVYAALALLLYIRMVGETHLHDDRDTAILDTFKGYWRLLKQPSLVAYLVTGCACFGGMYAWLTETPYVYIQLFEVLPQHYGYLFGIGVLATIVCAFLNSWLVIRLGPLKLMTVGIVAACVSTLPLVGLELAGDNTLFTILVGSSIFVGLMGFVSTNALAILLNQFPHSAGTAVALFAFCQFGFGALCSTLASFLHDGSAGPMVQIMAGSSLLALAGRFFIKELAPPAQTSNA